MARINFSNKKFQENAGDFGPEEMPYQDCCPMNEWLFRRAALRHLIFRPVSGVDR
jgi:hypothetical protein